MRKIPEHIENPIDNIIYQSIDSSAILFRKMNFTPNMITTISTLFGVLSIYSLYKDKFALAGILYFISYYFDCLDGYYARKYDMVSKLGDYYDHVKDIAIFSGIIIMLFKKRIFPGLIFFIPIVILTFIHFGCQEIYYNKNESDSLKFTTYFCPVKNDKNKLEKMMKFTRYFGSGTLVLLFCIYLIILEKCKKQ
jgi:phosphatidylglycerophosphate synthase